MCKPGSYLDKYLKNGIFFLSFNTYYLSNGKSEILIVDEQ